MAAPHVFLVYSIKDSKGKISTTQINFPYNVDIGVLKTFTTTTAEFIDSLIHGQIVDAGIGLAVDLSGATLKAAPTAAADVEEGARFLWEAATGAKTGFRIPTFDETFMTSGTNLVDTANGAVDTFVQRILQGLTDGVTNVSPSDDRGSDIDTLASARESFTKSRSTG